MPRLATGARGRTLRPANFWDSELAAAETVRRIAFPTFPESLNAAMYRSMRTAVNRAIHREQPGLARVLDVGSGTGVWLEYWRRRGAGSVTGLDITDAGFDRLRARFPGVELVRAEIGAAGLALDERFDAVSAMNMLLHVTDDQRWEQALANLARLTKPDGLLIVMDPVVWHRERGPALGETHGPTSKLLTIRHA